MMTAGVPDNDLSATAQYNLLALKSLHIAAAVLLKAAPSFSFPDGCDSTGTTAILSITYVQGNFQETSGAVLIQCGSTLEGSKRSEGQAV
jgi:hypothetical protein